MEYRLKNGKTLTDADLDRKAREYEAGTWGSAGAVTRGRPRIFDEDMAIVSFRIPKSRLRAIEAAAARRGESKSDFFRNAIDAALANHP